MAQADSDNFWRVFAAIWLCVGLPFLAIGVWVGRDELPWMRLPADAVLTRGEVLSKERAAEGAFMVRYRFDTAPAGTMTSSAPIEEETWNRLVPHGPIRVMFLPQAPRIHLVEGHLRESKVLLAAILAGAGALLTFLGAMILARWYSLRGADFTLPARYRAARQPPNKDPLPQRRAARTKAEKRERRHQRVVEAQRPRPAGGWRSALATTLHILLFLATLFVATVAVELSPELRRLEAWTQRHELALLLATGAIAMLGLGMLVGSLVLRAIEDAAAARRGIATSQSSLEFSVRALKRSVRERRDFPWAAAIGAACVAIGVAGVTMSLMPMELKLVVGAILVYAAARTCWGILRA